MKIIKRVKADKITSLIISCSKDGKEYLYSGDRDGKITKWDFESDQL
jgi:hypothetical protein